MKPFFTLLFSSIFLLTIISGCTATPEPKEAPMIFNSNQKMGNPNDYQTPINPVAEGADPFILMHEGVYYLYSTNAVDQGYLVYSSTDMQTWENNGLCLKKEDVQGDFGFWAPEVMYYNEKFYMVYTAEEHLGIAVSDSPLGPFTQETKGFLSEEKSIDGHFFIDEDGSIYLYFVMFTGGNVIYGAKMKDDLSGYEENTVTKLLEAQYPWERVMERVMEGPSMLKRDGIYYLTYSANHFQSQDYAVGYATSKNPLSGFEKYIDNPILHKNGDIVGTGHHSFTTSVDGKQIYIVYHRHFSTEAVHPRMTCVDKVIFQPNPEEGEPDLLVVDGPT